MKKVLESEMSVDQAGSRANYSCDDHLFTTTIIRQRCEEFGLPLWFAAVDFRKAFDTVEHTFLWNALRELKLPET